MSAKPHAADRVLPLRAQPARRRQALQFPGARIRAHGIRRPRHHQRDRRTRRTAARIPRCRLSAPSIAVPRRSKCRCNGTGRPAQARQSVILRRVLAPVGLDYFWARAATRKALEVARNLPPGIVIATSPPHAALDRRRAHRAAAGWPLILDYRDPWSAYDWPSWHRGWFTQWLARAHRGAPGAAERRACAQHARACATGSRNRFPRRRAAQEFRGAERLRCGCGRATRPPATGPIEIVHAGEIYGSRSLVPLLRAVRTPERAPSRAADSRDHLRRAAGARNGNASATPGSNGSSKIRPRIPFAALFARVAARACAARRGQRPHAVFHALQGLRLHGRRPADPRARAERRGTVRVVSRQRRGRVRRARPTSMASSSALEKMLFGDARAGARAHRALPLVEPRAAVPRRRSRPSPAGAARRSRGADPTAPAAPSRVARSDTRVGRAYKSATRTT